MQRTVHQSESNIYSKSNLCFRAYIVLCSENQLNDIEKCCSNEIMFGVFQVDPTFDLGLFSVTATAFETLLLLKKDSKKRSVMMGPLLIHQIKEKYTYKVLSDFISSKREAF